ncbi:IS66 family insertion sequence hypothetical protein, partial [Rhodobacteraceae bacterium W635]|uniref:hypothetical protein n=1 Tax=Nioella halotolerans TaxID=2303578 RepID=UPI000E3D11EE
LKKKGLWSPDHGAVFLPVDMPANGATPSDPEPVSPVPVELRLANGRCLRFDSAMEATALTRLIRAVEKA